METIKGLASKALSSESGQRPRAEIDPRAADAVWVAFAEMFGSKLTAQFGDEPPFMWRKALSGMTREQINRGLTWVRAEGLEWPPSLPKFEAACLEEPKQIGKPAPFYRAVPAEIPLHGKQWEDAKKRAAPHLENIRRKLGRA